MRDFSKLSNLESRLRAAKKRDESRFEPRIIRTIGTVYEVDGTIYVPGYAQGVVHVLEWGSTSGNAIARTNGINVNAGVMVWMTKQVQENMYSIERVYDGILQTQYKAQASSYNVSKHAKRHQWPTEATKGDDAVEIYEPAIMPGKVAPYSLLTVSIRSFTYYNGLDISVYPDSTFNLTSYMPASGNQKFVLLYMDPSDNLLKLVSGTETLNSPVITPIQPEAYPGTYPLALILLKDGTTTLAADYIFSARSMISPVTSEIGELFMSAAGGWPSTTNGCAPNEKNESTTNKQNYYSLDFASSFAEYAEWTVLMPHDWDGGPIAASFVWTAASGSGQVAWRLQAVAYVNDDAIDIAWGNSQVAASLLTAAGDTQFTGITNAITIAGSPSPNSLVQFRVYRDVSVGNNLNADGMLLGVKVYFTKTKVQTIDLIDLPDGLTQLGSISADAVIRGVGSVDADATIFTTQSSSVTADAVIVDGLVLADAAIQNTQSDSASADATIENAQSGSVTANADIV